ncbi:MULTISPECIES: GNAT family N-acetyltransferase [Enterococcus]|uniref:GNAT family N-acetyltransferase n=1 Tax=Enterococcus TaxID=1350 RepID=UPI0003309DAC|nr:MULTISPECIES: GNAT family N-acetyltransferase [Enterococcus]EOH60902.1 hypothetical protein UAC_02444 [Enterococcus mundtii ATCC 882]EOU11874.1 hypothetical protein I587_00394 [Enterococcus mundtii ATCC 882]PJK24872.1 GNAT family N-acetyltransferase [Enterococcus mundtii]
MILSKIIYGSKEYDESLILRDEILRKPLGVSIFNQDYSNEIESIIIGAFEQKKLIGVGIMSSIDSKKRKLEFLCVDENIQSQGVGKQILEYLENIAVRENSKIIELDARFTAVGFYNKMGYETYGDTYLLKNAPTDHIKMIKNFN